MLQKDESKEHVEEWSNKHEAEVQESDTLIEKFQNRIKELKGKENKEWKAEEDQIEEKCIQQR